MARKTSNPGEIDAAPAGLRSSRPGPDVAALRSTRRAMAGARGPARRRVCVAASAVVAALCASALVNGPVLAGPNAASLHPTDPTPTATAPHPQDLTDPVPGNVVEPSDLKYSYLCWPVVSNLHAYNKCRAHAKAFERCHPGCPNEWSHHEPGSGNADDSNWDDSNWDDSDNASDDSGSNWNSSSREQAFSEYLKWRDKTFWEFLKQTKKHSRGA
ncbi:MAG TPA: hypothetical protein VGB74_19125 [Actinoplanes sp.]